MHCKCRNNVNVESYWQISTSLASDNIILSSIVELALGHSADESTEWRSPASGSLQRLGRGRRIAQLRREAAVRRKGVGGRWRGTGVSLGVASCATLLLPITLTTSVFVDVRDMFERKRGRVVLRGTRWGRWG